MSDLNTYFVTPNKTQNGIYTGECYVFESSGGFAIESTFPEINLAPMTPLSQFDVTEAIQMTFSVRKLNDQLGIIKDECNNVILEVLNYDLSGQSLQTDSINIESTEFLNSINSQNIISMGNLSTLYSDFNYTVMQYFGDPTGLNTLFSYNNTLQMTNGVFDPASFLNLINGITFNIDGYYITDLSGSFTINDVNNHLRYVCDTNVFGNRTDTSDFIFETRHGFLEGDLVFIPNGMSITLNVNIEVENFNNDFNFGPRNLSKIDDKINYTNTHTNVSKYTTYSLTNITQTFTVPILLVLTNKDTFNMSNFCQNWIDATTNTSVGKKNWLAVSLSGTGQFQAAVNSYGDIYVSNNYGNSGSWKYVFNIGTINYYPVNPSLSNSIAISANGQFITASNGSKIYVSNNYGDGSSWQITKEMNPTNIFVCISLNGQYQSVISCGDNIYASSDYGCTWYSITHNNSDLYNSITAFQFAGISISYNGRYQTIACEHIYLSSNYGENWYKSPIGNDIDFDDRNWTGCSISSEGQYQTAIDSGGYIYTSSNYGEDWKYIITDVAGNNNWVSVSISANGKFQTVLNANNGSVYFSTNYGNDWNTTHSTVAQNYNFQAVSISANGQYQTAVENGGAIYISNLI